MALCTVSGTFLDPQENPVSGVTIQFVIDNPFIGNTGGVITPTVVSTTTDVNGLWSLAVTQNSSGTFKILVPPNTISPTLTYTFGAIIPTASTAAFTAVWVNPTNFTPPTNFPLTFAMISGQLATGQLPVLASADFWVGNGSSAATAVLMSGDATMINTGAVTVVTVGTSTAANIHTAELAANAATSANTATTIVKRDGAGNFSAGTIIATLNGLATNVSGIVAIANGGTNSSTALNNNRVVKSSGGAIVEAAAITANKALISDSNGIPTQSTTSNTELGYVTGVTSAIQTQIDTTEKSANKGAANGYAPLDSSSKVPYANLPSALMTFKGAWNANTNSPTLADGTGTTGDTYRASVAGTQNLGSGSQTWAIGDFAIYNGTIWQHSPAADGVSSVNGSTGAVTVNAINQLTSDVTAGPASGSASAAATVASVGGSTAANVHTAELAANAATASNTVSTIVKRDGSGNFSAGTITAALSGNATTATTATNVSGTVAIANGGTGQTTKAPAFDALQPMTTGGDLIYGGASGTGTRLANGSSGQILTSGGGTAAPTWTTLTSGTTSTDWVSFTPTITGTTTNPTKGTTSYDLGTWRRVGDSMEIRYNYNQTTAGTDGSGSYLFLIPNSNTIDTAKQTVSSTVLKLSVGAARLSNSTDGLAGTEETGWVQPWDSTHLALVYIQSSASTAQIFGSGQDIKFANTHAGFSFTAVVPITGWTHNN